MIIATTYPGGLVAIGLTIAAACAGLVSLLVFVSAAVAVKWISSRRMRILLGTAHGLMLCAIGGVILSVVWEAIDEIHGGTIPSAVAERLLADWPYYAALVALLGIEVVFGRLLQRRAGLNRS